MQIHTFACGPFETNTYLIEDEETGQAILIDPTMESEGIYDEIMARGLRLALIVNTHGHVDHAYANAFFKEKTGAPLLIHKDDALWLGTVAQQAVIFGLDAPPPSTADRRLQDGDTITAGNLAFQVLHTPGHTPGGICLYGHGILLSGDTLFAGSIGRTDLPAGSYETLLTSIRSKLLALPAETVVYSGHGPATTIGHEMMYNPFLE